MDASASAGIVGRTSQSSEAAKSVDSWGSAQNIKAPTVQVRGSARSRGENSQQAGIQRTASDASSSSHHRYGTPPDGDDLPLSNSQILPSGKPGRPLPGGLAGIDPSMFELPPGRDGPDTSRRRSYVRATGTASSPDLKTLVQKKALEAVQQGKMTEEMATQILGESVASSVLREAAASNMNTASAHPRDLPSVPSADDTPRMQASESGFSSATLPANGKEPPSSPPVPPKEVRDPSAANTFARARRKTTSGKEANFTPSSSAVDGLGVMAQGGGGGGEVMSMRSPARSSSNLPLGNFGRTSARLNTASSDASTVLGDSSGSGLMNRSNGSESISLAQELADSSPRPDDKNGPSSGGLFKGRMKKSGGFLRAFRSSARSKSQDPNRSSDGAETPGRRSFSSQNSSSVDISATGNEGKDFVDDAGVPVPSIPTKYAREQQQAMALNKSRRDKEPAPTPDQPRRPSASAASVGGKTPQLQQSSLVGAPPARPPRATVPAVSSSGSAGTAEGTGPQPARKPRILQGGSDGSGQDLKRALKAWENEMDDTLKTAAQDLDKKMDLTPRAQWGPSPRLPELDGIERARSRAGSFMDDPQWETSKEQQDVLSGKAAKLSLDQTSSFDAGSSSQRSPSVASTPLGLGIGATANGNTSIRSDGDAPTARPHLGTFRSASAGPENSRSMASSPANMTASSAGVEVGMNPMRRPSLPVAELSARRRAVSPASSSDDRYNNPASSIRVIPRRGSTPANDDGDSLKSRRTSLGGKALPVPAEGTSIQRQPSPGLSEVTRGK